MKLQHTNSSLEKSTDKLHNIAEVLLKKAKDKGASDASVSISEGKGFSVDVRMQEVETVAFHQDKGIGLTVYIGKQKGHASSTDFSEEALDDLVEKAYDIAKISAKDECFGLADAALLIKKPVDLSLYHPWDVTTDEALEKALACEKIALGLDPRIINSDGVNVSTHGGLHWYTDTHGARGFHHGTRHSLSCSLIAKSKNDTMQRDYEYTTARNAFDLASIDFIAKEAASHTLARLDARKVATGELPVIFSSRISSGLFMTFISAISGGNLYRKNSFLLDSLGKLVFPEWLNIQEDPYLLNGLGSAAFDEEGVITRRNIFVEKGCVAQYILGSYSAKRMGLVTTANSGGVHNVSINNTVDTLSDLIKMIPKGLLITELMGQGINILTGDYSRGAAGFWVEDGKIQFPVEEITIAGNLSDMFKNIVAIAGDVNPNIATQVGSVLIGKMMVGGK